MDPKTRGWKMLNLALGDSDENNTYTVLNENPNNIEFILELGGGEPMTFHTKDTDVQSEGIIPTVPEIEEIQYINTLRSPSAGTNMEKEICAEGTNNDSFDSSFKPYDDEFGHDSSSNNEDAENNNHNTALAQQTEFTVSEVEAEESKTTRKKRKRQTKGTSKNWQCYKNKFKRMKGEEYNGLKKDSSGKRSYNVKKAPRKIGPPCSSNECRRVKTRVCPHILEADRQRLFTNFWHHMDWKQRKVYVSSLVSLKEKKRPRKTDDSPSRRKGTLHYNLKIKDELHPVCKSLFLSTFALGEWTVRNWVMKGEDGIHQDIITANKNSKTAKRDEKREFADAFFNKLPKMPSHYCRASTSKEYLEPLIQSKCELHRIYAETCQNEGREPLARKQFLEIFKEKNLGLFQPKKDQCDTCLGYKHKQISEEVYAEHVKRKDMRRDLKKEEKEKAIKGEQLTYTMDLQAVKLSPMLKASALYYKMKLCVHNFTLHNIATKDVSCYLWNESEGGLVAAVFASCVTDFLSKEIEKHKANSVVVISDGCTYQNRNAVLGNAMLKLAIEKNVTITQHYLEKGHTQMEVDSVHSTIEGKLKNKEIYLPSDYARICKEVRPKQRYEVQYLDYTFFKDFSAVCYVSSIRPGKGSGDPVVTDVCSYRYLPKGEIQYKINVTDEWLPLPQRLKRGPFELLQLYPARLMISEEKFNHLQELKKVIPQDCHRYYDELPHC